MTYINCNYLYYADDLKDIKLSANNGINQFEFDINDIVWLGFKENKECSNSEDLEHSYLLKNNMNIAHEFIIADTDLNALNYVMDSKAKKYKRYELLPMLRYSNIDALSVELGDNVLNPVEIREYVALYFNPEKTDIKYKASNSKDELECNLMVDGVYKNLLIFTKDEVMYLKKMFKDIVKKQIPSSMLNKMFIINPKCEDLKELSEIELKNFKKPIEMVFEEFSEFMEKFNNAEVIEGKKKIINEYMKFGYKFFKTIDRQMLDYQSLNIYDVLNNLSLGRISPRKIEKANTIHLQHAKVYQELKEIESVYYSNMHEAMKMIDLFESK